MKTKEDILLVLRAALGRVVGKRIDLVKNEQKLVSDFGLESVDMVDLLYEIERDLNLSINLSDVFSNKRSQLNQRDQFDLSLDELADFLSENIK